MNNLFITIDIHPSGNGFQIVGDLNSHIVFPKAVKQLRKAITMAYYLRDAVNRLSTEETPSTNIKVTQRAIDYCATSISDNRKVYREIQRHKLKVQN